MSWLDRMRKIDKARKASEMTHQQYTPYQPAVEAREGIRQWAQGVASRSSPQGMLSALASEARRYKDMPTEELATSFGPSGGLVGMFAGKGAKTADLANLAIAEKLKSQGVADPDIWKQTGWTLDTPDKMPRFEIPDNAASMMQDAPSQLSKYPGRRQSQIFAHDDLYGAYPESADIWTGKIPGEYGGSYAGGVMGKSDMVNIGIPKKNIDLNEVAGTNLHELQHAIQQREGFARGGSPTELDQERRAFNKLPSDPQEAYRRLAGEAEARLTQARMNLTPEQRLAQYPYDPQYFEQATGVPLSDLIVRKEGGTAMMLSTNNPFTR